MSDDPGRPASSRPAAAAVAVRGTWRWTAFAVAGLLVVTILVTTEAVSGVDSTVTWWWTRWDQPGLAHAVPRTVVMGGQFWLMGSVVAVAALVRGVLDRSPRPVLVCGGALLTLSTAVWCLKHLVGRTSPGSGLDEVFSSGLSYPSGHTATATLGVGLLVLLARPRDVPAPQRLTRAKVLVVVAVSGAVGLSTVVLGYHWVSDVVGGWFIAVAVLLPALALLRSGTQAARRR